MIKEEVTYSISESQDILGKEKSTIYRMIKQNLLPISNDVRPIRLTKSQLRSGMLRLAPKNHLLWQDDRIAS